MMDEIVRLDIENIAAGGAGFARFEGISIFVDGSAPGETVICRITENHRSWLRAQIVEIEKASPDRTAPACPYYGLCGGCNLQHLDYPSQLTAKAKILKDVFFRIGGFEIPEPLTSGQSSNQWEYRNRIQLHCISSQYGFKAKKSNEIIPVSDCPVADPGIRNFLKSGQLFSPPPEKDRFTVYARAGLFLSEGGIQRGKTQVLDRELILDAGVFFQSNGMMLEKLVTDLREITLGLSAEARNLPMADLYCGVGTFAVFLGEFFPHADLVEENKTALTLTRENLPPLVSGNFFAQKTEDWIKNADCSRYGFIIADPPRQGLSPAVSRRLAAAGPPFFAYVSCDPATLARDSKILLEGGYELADLRLYDFYPQTSHIESLAFFAKG